ncbi:ubiquitin-conjugating enzyme E2 C [Exaiptasia diaphana]|uniref:UBC core domain-containing protein n=1 Tax=Exaiptasia diaphana TaxID=2652724 RepID=A0A913Y805_EXADI|nr:ubiquitin-conjugating enzyme E2 C [Exaiptasia diaphana]KXJ22110.1 Ubiquitin-conjugating enzyme E2 C [Exaiptasia diaphana]
MASGIPRLSKDLKELVFSEDPSISAFPESCDMLHWVATITGVKETVYEGLKYKLTIEFTDKYPYEAPTVKFKTPCYHPNVDTKGNICLDILTKDKWVSTFTVRTLLLSLQSLLGDPNLRDPLNTQAADLWKNKKEFIRTLQEYHQKNSLKETN